MTDRDDELDLEDQDELDEGDELVETTESGGGRSGTLSFMAGMVLGALVGAGVALLVAPERGAVTRRRLKKFVGRLSSDAKERAEDWRDDVKAELKRRRRQIREQIER
jgi:gas vesicle protein